MTPQFSRRYVCRSCGYKGRVSKLKRGPIIKCPKCEETQKANRQEPKEPQP